MRLYKEKRNKDEKENGMSQKTRLKKMRNRLLTTPQKNVENKEQQKGNKQKQKGKRDRERYIQSASPKHRPIFPATRPYKPLGPKGEVTTVQNS